MPSEHTYSEIVNLPWSLTHIMKAVSYPTLSCQKRAEIAIFDAQIDDLFTLLNGLRPGIEAFVLHPREDGLAQISAILASRKEICTLHLISHGAPGQLFMGRLPITAEDLTIKTLNQWQQSFSSNAEILIYGCNVAAGVAGRALISQLYTLTGMNVAASSTPTGNATLGGNWNFEITSSDFTPTMAFDAAGVIAYAGLLAN
ncbi:MAG: DUF4347 domain-containing protein [Cyanobacteria bacterium J06638_20]